ncbi:MAG: molybdenum cofactor biosynthesis protein MoaE [Planctomycetota bacterium]
MIRLVDEPIQINEIIEATATTEDGGVCVFVGRTRAAARGRRVVRLAYEAYRPMALAEIEKIVACARERFGVERLSAVHRLGDVGLGEASVVVVAAARHRDEAFRACRFVIDELKKTVPIWKNEIYADGSAWVGDPDSSTGHLAKRPPGADSEAVRPEDRPT